MNVKAISLAAASAVLCLAAVSCDKKNDLGGLSDSEKEMKNIVEQYVPFDEINMTFIAQDGDIQLVAVHDRYFNQEQESATKAPDLYIYPSRYTDLIQERYSAKIIEMLKGIGIQNGSLFIQAIIREKLKQQ